MRELTPNHETFVQARATGMPIADAYMIAFPRIKKRDTAHTEGWKLLQRPNVKIRLRELLDQFAEQFVTSRESLAAELDDAIEQAARLDQPAARVAGIMAKARLFGLEAPKRIVGEHTHNHIARMSDEEVRFELLSLLNEARIKAGGQALALPPPPASRVAAEKAAEAAVEAIAAEDDEDVNFLGDDDA